MYAKSQFDFGLSPIHRSEVWFETIRSATAFLMHGAAMAMGIGGVADDGVGLGDGAPGCVVPAEIRACAVASAENSGETRAEGPPRAVDVGQPCGDEADAPGS